MLQRLLRRFAPAPAAPADSVAAALAIRSASRPRLGRSLSVLCLDAGSCRGCALEAAALPGAAYDAERHGLRFVDDPRAADVLLVSGPVSRNMAEALRRARAAMPEPAWVVAAGDCAGDGGCFRAADAVEGGVAAVLAVDLVIPGCPPTPEQLLDGLLALLAAEANR